MNSSSRRQFGLFGICVAFAMGLVVATAGSWMGWSLWITNAEKTHGNPSYPTIQIEHTESSELGVSESATHAQTGIQNATLEEISRIPTEFSRNLALSSIALESNEARLLDLIDQAEKFHIEFRTEAQRVFVGRLYEIDPELTLTNLENFPVSIAQFIFRQQARTDLADAIARAKSLEGEIRQEAILGILSHRPDISAEQMSEIGRELGSEHLSTALAEGRRVSEIERDPEKAWYETLRHSTHDSDQVETLVTTALTWIRQDGFDTIEEINATLEDTLVREGVLKSVLLSAMHFTESKDVFSKARELDVDSDKRILSIVAASWARSDPLSALDAVNEVESRTVRDQLLHTVIHNWARTDPRAILVEIERFSNDMQVAAREVALRSIARSNPREAISLTENLSPGAVKSKLVSEIASMWAEQDSEEALAWVLAKQESANGRSQLLSTVVMGWSHRDPIAALNWVLEQHRSPFLHEFTLPTIFGNLADVDPELAMQRALEQPISPHRFGLEHKVISQIAQYDTQLAKTMLPRTREGETRVNCYAAVGLAMIGESKAIEALELASDLFDSDRKEYVATILSHWVKNDPQDLVDGLNQISDPQIQSSAAAELISKNQWSNILTDDQVEYVRKYLAGVEPEIIQVTR